MTPETKKELTRLKGEYSGDPFDEDGAVTIEFLCFVVEYYEKQRNETLDEIRKRLTKKQD